MITWLLYPILEAFIQAFWIEKVKRRPDYDYLKMVRGAVFFAWAIYMVKNFKIYVDLTTWDSLWTSLVLFCWAPTTFFLFFNPLLNKLRNWLNPNLNLPLNYKGKDSGMFDAWSYSTLRRFRIACAIVAVISFLFSMKWYALF